MSPSRHQLLLTLCSLIIHICNSQSTCEGNANNDTCIFPFLYSGVEFNQCTYYGRTRPWCSTTYDYSTDGLWGYCDCNDQSSRTPSPTPIINIDHPHFSYTQGALNNGVLSTIIVNLNFQK